MSLVGGLMLAILGLGVVGSRDVGEGCGTAPWLSAVGEAGTVSRPHAGCPAGDAIDARRAGARGDGLTDDTMALQRAIDSVPPGGGTVFLPAGVYLTSRTLSVSRANIRLVGSGGSTVLRARSPSHHLLTLSGTGSGIVVADLQLQGTAGTDATGQYGIFTDASLGVPTRVLVSRVIFSGPNERIGLNNGIKIHTGGHEWKVVHSTFERLIGTAAGRGYGVLFGAAHRAIVAHNHFNGSPGQGRHGVYLSAGASFNLVANNVIRGFAEAGMNIHSPSTLPPCEFNLITGNLVMDSSRNDTAEAAGIAVEGAGHHNVISNNQVVNSGTQGIIVSDNGQNVGPSGNVIRGNHVRDAAKHGIQVIGGVDTVVEGNVVEDVSRRAPGRYSGIVVHSYPAGHVARNNRIVNNIGFGRTPVRSGIHLGGTVPVQANTVVTGNVVVAGNRGSVEVDGAVTTAVVSANVEGAGTTTRGAPGRLRVVVDWAPPRLSDGAVAATTVRVAGALPGDTCVVSRDRLGPRDVLVSCHVEGPDSVRVVITNRSGRALGIGHGMLRVDLWRR